MVAPMAIYMRLAYTCLSQEKCPKTYPKNGVIAHGVMFAMVIAHSQQTIFASGVQYTPEYKCYWCSCSASMWALGVLFCHRFESFPEDPLARQIEVMNSDGLVPFGFAIGQ